MESTLAAILFASAAFLSALATLGTLITGILFFAVHEKYGRSNDIFSVFQSLFMLPLAIAIYLLTRRANTPLAILSLTVGGVGMITVVVLQSLLVFRKVSFEQTIGLVLSAGAVIGIWLVLINSMALAHSLLPPVLGVFGLVAGAGYLIGAVGFHTGGQKHPLFTAGSTLIVVGYLVWATWIARLYQTGALQPV